MAVVVLALAAAAPAYAAFPGENGRIAFTRSEGAKPDIYSAEPSGGGLLRLTHDGVSLNPAFSPDGTRLAFTSGTKVYIGDQYANDPVLALDMGVGAYELDWSPDGTRLVASFPNCADAACEPDVYVFGTDGSALTNITNTVEAEYHPAWSPDGSKIAFDSEVGPNHDIYVMNPDGTNIENLTGDLTTRAMQPDWRPDAMKIAFQSDSELTTMNPDGTGKTELGVSGGRPAWSPDASGIAYDTGSSVRITGTPPGPFGSPGAGEQPDWQVRLPVPAPAPGGSGYVRPAGATPFRVPLVPAYAECTSLKTRQHGPPLAYPSCRPVRGTERITVGTPDAFNGQPAVSVGSVRFSAMRGNPSTPADEADVGIQASITDVRYNFGPKFTFPDYPGKLVLSVPVRITDLYNGGAPDGSATTVDVPIFAHMQCTPTPEPPGATCATQTTMEAITPGSVPEQRRSVWEVGKVSVHDAGIDGNPDGLQDNTVFAVQGVFVP